MDDSFRCARRGDWSSLDDFAIDKIVEHLKETGQWNRDGHNLRLLNKHWRSNIYRHVTHAHPRRDRIILEEDLDSLSKFPNLTSVDFNAFLLFKGKHSMTMENLFGNSRSRQNQKYRLHILIEKLQRIPKLNQLKICWPLREFYPYLIFPEAQLAVRELTTVKKLVIDDSSGGCDAIKFEVVLDFVDQRNRRIDPSC